MFITGLPWATQSKNGVGFFFFFFFFFFPVFSREKLQILRNIACIRLNSDAAAVLLARLEHRHNNLIEGSTRGRET